MTTIDIYNKLKKLIKQKESILGIKVIKTLYDPENNAHILAKRTEDSSHIVWSAFNTGEEKTSYVNFHNGSYDLALPDAVNELLRRTGVSIEEVEVNHTYAQMHQKLMV